MNRISFLNHGYAFKGLLAVLQHNHDNCSRHRLSIKLRILPFALTDILCRCAVETGKDCNLKKREVKSIHHTIIQWRGSRRLAYTCDSEFLFYSPSSSIERLYTWGHNFTTKEDGKQNNKTKG